MQLLVAFEDADGPEQVRERARVAAAAPGRTSGMTGGKWRTGRADRPRLSSRGRPGHGRPFRRSPSGRTARPRRCRRAARSQQAERNWAVTSRRPRVAKTTAAARPPSWLRLTANSRRCARLASSAACPLSSSVHRPPSSWWTSMDCQAGRWSSVRGPSSSPPWPQIVPRGAAPHLLRSPDRAGQLVGGEDPGAR